MPLDNYCLGARVKSCRRKKGFSQSKLSELIDKSPTYLSFIETGNKGMSLETFVDIANALDVSADELLIDSLDHIAAAANGAWTSMMSDCSPYEQRVLLDLMRSAKEILRMHYVYLVSKKVDF